MEIAINNKRFSKPIFSYKISSQTKKKNHYKDFYYNRISKSMGSKPGYAYYFFKKTNKTNPKFNVGYI